MDNVVWTDPGKYVLPALGMALIALFPLLRARRHDFFRGVVIAALFWVAVASAFVYGKDSWGSKRYLNCYEFFHYYLGSKYWPELGYSDLYESAVIAQKEAGRRDLPPTVRDLVAGRSVSTPQVLQKAEEHKKKFSAARWEEFKGDVAFFRSYFSGTKSWNKMMNDKGYNPAPMWTLAGGTLSNLTPTSSYGGMLALASIDLVFMGAAALCVLWAFGPRAAFFLALVLCTQYVSSHTHMKASFMRMDWIMCLVMAACFVKKSYWKTAGVLLGWAACSRVFPAVFAFGIGAKLLLDLAFERRINRNYVQFLAAFGVSVVVFAAASWLYTGTEYWREFITKISGHNDDISAWRVGFKYVWLLSYRGGSGLAQQYEAWINWYHAIQLGVLAISIGLVRKLEDYEAFCYGIVIAFFLVAPTYYYYILILMAALFFASKLDAWPRALGAGLVLAEGVLAHIGHAVWDRTYPQFFSISVMVMIIVVYMMALSAFAPKKAPVEPTPA